MKINPDLVYPIGSHYITEDSANPSLKFGGTWELVRRTYGGELLAYGVAKNTTTGSTVFAKDSYRPMSDLSLSPEILMDYSGQNILRFNSGTWHIYPQGIVGLIKSTSTVTGIGASGTQGIWWSGNSNTLPTGVTMSPSTRCPLTGGINGANYGGGSLVHTYKVDGVTENFYVNPKFTPYGGAMTPGSGGVGCVLQIEVYASTGLHYIWKRTA